MLRSFRSLLRPSLFRFATEASKEGQTTKAVEKAKVKSESSKLTFYQNGELATRSSIVLKGKEDVESYVIKTVQNYFRTTYKEGSDCC